MSEYINRKQILDYISERKSKMIPSVDGKHDVSIETVEDIIKDFPTVDVVPVVFCRDCVNHECCSVEDTMSFARLSEDKCFCSVGKRKK